MRRVQRLFSRISWLASRRRSEAELQDEIDSVLDLEIAENIRCGMAAEEARRLAVMRIGGVAQLKETYREHAGLWFFEQFWTDVSYAFRLLRTSPGYTFPALLTLALGIGANTMMFSIVNAVLLKPLPYPNADNLVVLREVSSTGAHNNVSWPDFLDWRAQSRTLEDVSALQPWDAKVTYGHSAEAVNADWVTASYFGLLGRRTSIGRVFAESEDNLGAPGTAVLSHAFWLKFFGGDRGVVGRAIQVDGQPFTVIGVLPPNHETWFSAGDIFLPLGLKARNPEMTPRSNHPAIVVLGRLKHGATIETVRAEFAAIMSRLGGQYPESNRGETADVTAMQDDLLYGLKRKLLILLWAVGFVLLLACANVSHLALGRAAARKREFAMRAAVGASSGRLLKQVMTESLLLSFFGSALALIIAQVGVPAIVRLYGDRLAGLSGAHSDAKVLAFTLLISMLATVLFGSAPAIIASRTDPNPVLKNSTASLAARWNWRGLLIGAEVAIAFVLCVASMLLVESLRAVVRVDPGFQPDGIVIASILRTHPMDAQTARFFADVVDAVKHQPGVESASAALSAPLKGMFWTSPFDPHARSFSSAGTHPWTMLNMILPGYFETIKAKTIAGRAFNERDGESAPPVAIVSASMAKAMDPAGKVVGRDVFAEYAPHQLMRIVGVVADIKQTTLDQDPMPVIYVPERQVPMNKMTLVVRIQDQGGDAEAMLKRAVASVDPEQPISEVYKASDLLSGGLRLRRFITVLLSTFAVLGLVLAMTGVAGVVSYAVARRSREIGIRLAIGARPVQALGIIIKQSMIPACAGILIGCALAWSVARLLASMLFGVSAHDPGVFLSAIGALGGAALLACLIPARRALTVNAVDSLRAE